MGSESSKPLEPPAEWETRVNHKFKIISPMSDLSNPSDMRKEHHFTNSQALQRRASRTVTTSLPKEGKEVPAPSAFYFPTKQSEKYAERVSNSNKNKENSKPNRLRKTKKIFTGCFEDRDQQQERQQIEHVREVEMPQQHQSNVRQTNSKPLPIIVERGRDPKPRKISDFDAKNKQKGLMSDVSSNDKMGRKSSTSDNRDQRRDKHQKPTVKRVSDPGAMSKRSGETAKRSEAQKNATSVNKAFVMRETEGLMMPDPYQISARKIIIEEPAKKDREPTPVHQSEHDKAAELALHEEDAYFSRLMGNENSRVSYPSESPMLANNGNLVGTLSSSLDSKATPSQMDSPVNNLFRSAPSGYEQPSPLLHLEKEYSQNSMNKNSSVLDNKPDTVSDAQSSSAAPTESVSSPSNQSSKRQSSATHSDAVNDLLRFQAKYGQAHDIPAGEELSFRDEEDAEKSVEVFLDETNEEESLGPSMDNLCRASQQKEAPGNSPASATDSKVSTVTMGTFSTCRSLLEKSTQLEGRVDDRLLQKILSRDQEDIEDRSVASEEDSYFKPEEVNVASAFRSNVNLPTEPLKQIASLGPTQGTPREKKSKLESLFRPMLPAFSADDAESRLSFDPYEIKVTESAPSLIESKDYRAIALHGSPASEAGKNVNALAMFSPSVLSIDSQFDENPSPARPMVSSQASYNGDFLFSSKLGKTVAIQPKKNGERDSSMFSISTIGARSRLSQPARSKAITIPIKSSASVISKDSSNNSDDDRHVRFSGDAEAKFSLQRESTESEKSSFGNIVVPGIERNFSDLTDNMSEYGSGSSTGRSKVEFQSDPIPEEPADGDIEINDDSSEDEEEEEKAAPGSPEVLNRVQWSYRGEEGDLSAVTPHLKGGKPITNATNSPFLRFKAAKSKFVKPVPKESPVKRASNPLAKRKFSVGSGVVSNRVQELNKRASEVSNLRKKDRRSSLRNPRRCDVMNKPLIRTPVIMNYKTDASGVGMFSLLGDQSDDDDSTDPEEHSDSQYGEEEEHADDVSQLSSVQDFGMTRDSIPQSSMIEECEDEDEDEDEDCDDQTSFTQDTVLQEKSYGSAAEASSYQYRRESQGTMSTASSGFSGVRKEVFGKESNARVSFASSRRSNVSDGESTTMSSILNKENSSYLPFRSGANVVKPTEQRSSKRHDTAPEALHLSPTQRTPLQARKWRSLAAAAKEKGPSSWSMSSKTSGSSSKSRRGLSERHRNQIGPTYAC
jgi:hypothetical protein